MSMFFAHHAATTGKIVYVVEMGGLPSCRSTVLRR